MVEFRDLTDRVFLKIKNRIKKEVFKQDYIDYLELDKYIDYLKCEPNLMVGTKLPVVVSLASAFKRGQRIDNLIIELDTYYSMYDKLVEIELIKKITRTKIDNEVHEFDFEPPTKYEIISHQEFLEFTEGARKATIIYILRLKLGRYIEDRLDEISNRGKFSFDKISEIYKEIKSVQKTFDDNIRNISDDKGSGEIPNQAFEFNDKEVRNNVFNSLKAYFDDSNLEALSKLLNSEQIDFKLNFKGSCKALCYPFRQLHLHNKLVNQKTTTKNWICDNFNYKYQGKFKECNKENVHKNISKADLSYPKSQRIMIPNLDHLELNQNKSK